VKAEVVHETSVSLDEIFVCSVNRP